MTRVFFREIMHSADANVAMTNIKVRLSGNEGFLICWLAEGHWEEHEASLLL